MYNENLLNEIELELESLNLPEDSLVKQFVSFAIGNIRETFGPDAPVFNRMFLGTMDDSESLKDYSIKKARVDGVENG